VRTDAANFDGFGRQTSYGPVAYTYDGFDRTLTRNGTTFTYSGTNQQPTGDGTNLYARSPAGAPVAHKTGTTTSLIMRDRHGDLAALHTASASVTESHRYDPFGKPASTSWTGQHNNNVGYQADWTDPTTALVNMGARWYNPAADTFTTRDTNPGVLRTPVSLNRYTYANNNPLTYFDPDGQCTITPDDNNDCKATRLAAAQAAASNTPAQDTRSADRATQDAQRPTETRSADRATQNAQRPTQTRSADRATHDASVPAGSPTPPSPSPNVVTVAAGLPDAPANWCVPSGSGPCGPAVEVPGTGPFPITGTTRSPIIPTIDVNSAHDVNHAGFYQVSAIAIVDQAAVLDEYDGSDYSLPIDTCGGSKAGLCIGYEFFKKTAQLILVNARVVYYEYDSNGNRYSYEEDTGTFEILAVTDKSGVYVNVKFGEGTPSPPGPNPNPAGFGPYTSDTQYYVRQISASDASSNPAQQQIVRPGTVIDLRNV
jgi:RHS repeat-associated protein